MESIHVNEIVNNHDIVIPLELLKSLNHQEIDIVIFPEKAAALSNHKKNPLKRFLNRNKNIHPFKEITNPVAWQRKMRNEW